MRACGNTLASSAAGPTSVVNNSRRFPSSASVNAAGEVSSNNFGLGSFTGVLKSVWEDRQGQLWIGATDGLVRLIGRLYLEPALRAGVKRDPARFAQEYGVTFQQLNVIAGLLEA